MNLGTNIHRARVAAGLSLEQLAKKLGRVKSTVWAWEKGTHSPRVDELPEIAAALEVTVSKLMGVRTRAA